MRERIEAMKFKVVHKHPLEGADLGEKLLEPFDASLVKGVFDRPLSLDFDAKRGIGKIVADYVVRLG